MSSGIGQEAIIDGLFSQIFNKKTVRLHNGGVKARLDKIGERLDALIASIDIGEVTGGAALPVQAPTGHLVAVTASDVYDPATAWTPVETA